MKLKIVFGSKSDLTIAEILLEQLRDTCPVEFAILSAHRTPEELTAFLKNSPFDLCIAGAGLAAHLPGVIAAQCIKPVIGLPINNKLSGLDSLLSIQQMPSGIPVLSAGVEQIDAITGYLQTLNNTTPTQLCLVASDELKDSLLLQSELTRLQQIAGEWEVPVIHRSRPAENSYNIALISNEQDLEYLHYQDTCTMVCVPFFADTQAHQAETALTLLQWTSLGGLWLGINNVRNAFLSFVQSINHQGRWDQHLWNIRRR
jgi:5-(carboxyamino)imidazole ribonucleotide mutase